LANKIFDYLHAFVVQYDNTSYIYRAGDCREVLTAYEFAILKASLVHFCEIKLCPDLRVKFIEKEVWDKLGKISDQIFYFEDLK
jgi:hypothetical protein